VHLGDLEAGGQRAAGGIGEVSYQLPDLGHGRFVRDGQAVVRDRAGRHRLPAALALGYAPVGQPGLVHRRLTARVGELDRRDGAVRLDGRGDPGERLLLVVIPQAQVPGTDPPVGTDPVASAMTRPAPPAAREARWARWKSVGAPVSGPVGAAEYMHIGDIHTRLGIWRERSLRGVNRVLTVFLFQVGHRRPGQRRDGEMS
jgi:hypothetical protein